MQTSEAHTIESRNLSSDTAYSACVEYVNSKNGKDVVEDATGVLHEVNGRSLNYESPHNKPAVYYKSKWGNYHCACYVRIQHVYE
jgi:hypothetical protein